MQYLTQREWIAHSYLYYYHIRCLRLSSRRYRHLVGTVNTTQYILYIIYFYKKITKLSPTVQIGAVLADF